MNRRGFLRAMLAAGAAPAIVHAANIMPVFVRRESGLLAPQVAQFIVTDVGSSNLLLTPAMVTREALLIMNDKLGLGRDPIDLKAGSSVYIRGAPGALAGFQKGDVVTFGTGLNLRKVGS